MQLSPLSFGGEHISRSNPIAGFDDAQCTYDGDLFRDPAFRTLDFHKGMEITGDTPRSPFRFKRWLKFLIILIVLYSKKCSYELQIFELFLRCGMDRIPGFSPGIYRTAGQVLKQTHTFEHLRCPDIHEGLPLSEESQNRQDAHIYSVFFLDVEFL